MKGRILSLEPADGDPLLAFDGLIRVRSKQGLLTMRNEEDSSGFPESILSCIVSSPFSGTTLTPNDESDMWALKPRTACRLPRVDRPEPYRFRHIQRDRPG